MTAAVPAPSWGSWSHQFLIVPNDPDMESQWRQCPECQSDIPLTPGRLNLSPLNVTMWANSRYIWTVTGASATAVQFSEAGRGGRHTIICHINTNNVEHRVLWTLYCVLAGDLSFRSQCVWTGHRQALVEQARSSAGDSIQHEDS